MHSHSTIIGILGGMGPAASVDLHHRMLLYAQNRYHAVQDNEYPNILHCSMGMSGFTEEGIIDESLFRSDLISCAHRLESAGASAIVMPCNTAHYFAQDIQQSLPIPLLHIIQETITTLLPFCYTTIGLLASQTTRALKLYESPLEHYGIQSIVPTEHEQSLLNDVIISVMAGRQGLRELSIIKSVIRSLTSKGAQAIILGCTELPLAINISQTDVHLFDSTQILAEAAVNFALS